MKALKKIFLSTFFIGLFAVTALADKVVLTLDNKGELVKIEYVNDQDATLNVTASDHLEKTLAEDDKAVIDKIADEVFQLAHMNKDYSPTTETRDEVQVEVKKQE